jgi:thiamine pyrophosphate-dependent acetolactate synthase large subunit-like protein
MTPLSDKASFPQTHPQFRGMAPFAIGGLSKKLRGHDLIIVVGAQVFRYYPYVAGDYLPEGAELLQITSDSLRCGRRYLVLVGWRTWRSALCRAVTRAPRKHSAVRRKKLIDHISGLRAPRPPGRVRTRAAPVMVSKVVTLPHTAA